MTPCAAHYLRYLLVNGDEDQRRRARAALDAGRVAQPAEQRLCKPPAAGSMPAAPPRTP